MDKPDEKKDNKYGNLGGLFGGMGMPGRIFLAFCFAFLVAWAMSNFFGPTDPSRLDITYTEFTNQLEAANIKSVSIDRLALTGEFRKQISIQQPTKKDAQNILHFRTYLPTFQGEGLIRKMQEKDVIVSVVAEDKPSGLAQVAYMLFPWVLIIGLWIFFIRKSQQAQGGPGGFMGFGASKAKLFDATKPKVTFNDVAGMDNVKIELRETIEFLKDPSRFRRLGAKVPKGVLLMGPPGTGKTLLARATAGEAGVSFYSISAAEFIEMFVGVGASRVRDMFKKARSTQPSIIFIDEIDAVGRTRGAGLGGGHDEREQTLNQLLSEMDGFEPHEEIIIIAATNRPDVLDPALLRPGRFDRRIVIDRPGMRERKLILEVHVRDKTLSGDVDLDVLAKGSPGMTGADLENMANEAALIAVRKDKQLVEMSDFEEARDIILMGSVREDTISEIEKKITAYHEAGHALVAYSLPHTDPIHKISIIPRGMAMGVTQLLPDEDRHYYPKVYLMSRLCVALGGRVAEKIIFNDTSSGAHSDIKEATILAEKMIAQWGMSDKIGPVNLGRGEEHPFLGKELAQPKRYSEEMAWLIDQEIQKLMFEAESRAKVIIEKNRSALVSLAENLIRNETLDKDAVRRIIEESGYSNPLSSDTETPNP